MAAPKGNKFWLARSKHGRNPKFSDPEKLWDACCEYFDWVEKHPLWETKAFSFQGQITKARLPKMRAMTLSGLFLFPRYRPEDVGSIRKEKRFTPDHYASGRPHL